MRNSIAWLPILALPLLALSAGHASAAGETDKRMVLGILIAQDASEQIADFRLDRPPAMARVEKPLQDFAKAEGGHLSNQASSGQPSLTLSVNTYTTIFIIQPLPRGPLFFTLLMLPDHAAEKPAQLALFERLKQKLRVEFPDLTIE